MRTVLFYRHIRKFHGGHLKVWDYFNHVRASPYFTPRIGFSPKTRWDENNPWNGEREYVVEDPHETRPDVFFLAGRDWVMADQHPARDPGIPVINFLQHVRHVDPKSPRHEFIGRRAIRICVSEVVADAVREAGLAEGPVIAIPNSVDLNSLPVPGRRDQDIDLLIAALKQPERGRELEKRLLATGRQVVLLSRRLPRAEYLDLVLRARVTVFLPNESEGFYLPPLEGMAMGTLVICPEHHGERAVYRHGQNCLRPAYTGSDLAAAAEAALALDPSQAQAMRASARQTAESHSLEDERQAFHEILHNVDELW